MTFQSDVAPLRRVLLKHARDAMVSQARADEQWEALGWLARPDFDAACREYDAFARLLESLGASLEWMPAEDRGMDSMYVRDATVVTDRGVPVARILGIAAASSIEELTRLGVIARPARPSRPRATGRARPRPRRPLGDVVSEQRD